MAVQHPALRARIGEVVCYPKTPQTYVVAYPENSEEAKRYGLPPECSVTFARHTLRDRARLVPGQIVLLSNIVQHAKGWRARKAELAIALAPAQEQL